ncbi:hypothetical protein LB572_20910 [Mesorhizobium sp. BH1-1-5]|nr:hypothetical protein [Mesorhizobium sp. BH1-1-5]MBZ9989560.1 hypothetical protein [Mesorhizobium sp. BH1-1-5]
MDWSAGLLLHHHGSRPYVCTCNDIANLDQIAPAQLAVDCQSKSARSRLDWPKRKTIEVLKLWGQKRIGRFWFQI